MELNKEKIESILTIMDEENPKLKSINLPKSKNRRILRSKVILGIKIYL